MRNNNLLAKDTFKLIIILLVIILGLLPFATSFNELLTRIVESTGWYRSIQNFLVPYVSRIVVSVLSYLPKLNVSTFPYGVVINGIDVRITWNCLGWQSYLLFFASLMFGLRGNYTKISKFQTFLFGFMGIFVINIVRLVITTALVGWWRGLFMVLFHNYFSTFISIIWLFFFWWFSYKYILVKIDERIYENKKAEN